MHIKIPSFKYHNFFWWKWPAFIKKNGRWQHPCQHLAYFFGWRWPTSIKKNTTWQHPCQHLTYFLMKVGNIHQKIRHPKCMLEQNNVARFLWWKPATFITTEKFPSTLPAVVFFAKHRAVIFCYPLGVHAAPNFFCLFIKQSYQRDCSSSFDENQWLSSHQPSIQKLLATKQRL